MLVLVVVLLLVLVLVLPQSENNIEKNISKDRMKRVASQDNRILKMNMSRLEEIGIAYTSIQNFASSKL